MKRIALLLIVLLALGCAQSFAKTYTLEECIELAKRTDPELERYRNSVKTAGMSVWNQAGQFLPSAGFSLSYRKEDNSESLSPYDLGGGQVIDSLRPAYTFRTYNSGFRLDYTIFDGLQNIWNYLGSKSSKSVAENNLIIAESNIEYAVKGSYYLVLKSNRELKVAQETVKRSEELLKLFEEKYELGSASLSEVLKQKVQYGNDKLTLVQARNNYQVARYQLAITIGLDPREEYEIEDIPMMREKLDPVDSFIKTATAGHPSLLSAEAELSASKYDVRSAWGGYLPRLELQYTYGWQKNSFSDALNFDEYDRSATTYLVFSFNIFDNFSREYNLSRAKATVNNARANNFYTKNKVIKDIQDAYLGVKLAEEKLAVTEETERSASEDFELVQTKYNLGAAALWELLDAQVSLKSAQFNKVNAEFDYNLARARLLNAMGR